MVIKMNESYFCKIEDIHRLIYFPGPVRWINPDTDRELVREYFACFGIVDPDDTYFGICLNDLAADWSLDQSGIGMLCAYISDGRIVSLAGVEYISPDVWEIRAVSTHPEHAGKGYSKCVCSFVAKYILENRKKAICETNAENFAMRRVTERIGMTADE